MSVSLERPNGVWSIFNQQLDEVRHEHRSDDGTVLHWEQLAEFRFQQYIKLHKLLHKYPMFARIDGDTWTWQKLADLACRLWQHLDQLAAAADGDDDAATVRKWRGTRWQPCQAECGICND